MACKFRPKLSKFEQREVNFQPGSNYRRGVLLGFWAENPPVEDDVKPCHNLTTTYQASYRGRIAERFNLDAMWQNRIKYEGIEAPLFFDYDTDKYLKNFSTTYHLSYGHLPKVYCSKERPPVERDLTRNYGSLMDYGLGEFKKCEWRNSAGKHLKNLTTYEDHFREMERERDERIGKEYKLECDTITGECKVVCNKDK